MVETQKFGKPLLMELRERKETLKEYESDLSNYQHPETRSYILADIRAVKIQIQTLEQKLRGVHP